MNERTNGFDRHSRRHRLALLGTLLFVVQGCGTVSDSRVPSPRQGLYESYSKKLKATVEQLRLLDDQPSGQPLPFSRETRRALREGAAAFQGELARYLEITEGGKRFESSVPPETLERDLERLAQIQKSLRKQANTFSAMLDALDNQYESLQIAGVKELGDAQSYRATAHHVRSSVESIEQFLTSVHLRAIRPYANAPETPDEVFHFLRLAALRYPQLDAHGDFFRTAWNSWVDAAEKDRPGAALKILALVATEGNEYRPGSPQRLSEITQEVVGRKLDAETLERMRQAVGVLEEISGTLPDPAAWGRAVEKAKARILFSSAFSTDPSEKTVVQVIRALEMDRQLAAPVSHYLSVAGVSLANELVGAGKYGEALEALTRTLEAGPGVPSRAQIVGQFRADTAARALSEVESAVTKEAFAEADRLLKNLARLPKTDSETEKALELRKEYFEGYGRALVVTDPEKSLRLARETLRTFPGDASAQARIDRILFARLEGEIGDLDTAHQRIGGAEILKKVGHSVKRMMTETGTTDCQRLLELVEVNWRRQARTTSDAGAAFALEAEIARLNGQSEEKSNREAIAAIWTRFREAASGEDWPTVGSCIDVYFERFPEQKRPPNFKGVYLDYLMALDREKDLQSLGRHAALFVVAFPKDAHRIRSVAAKHANKSGSLSRGFSALLSSISSPEPNSGGHAGSDKSHGTVHPTLTAMVPKEVLAKKNTWWQEPQPGEQQAQLQGGATRRTGVGAAGIVLATGAALGVVVLCVLTFLLGFLSFRWYALAAFAVGVTTGYLLDRLPGDRPTHPQQESSVEAAKTTQSPGVVPNGSRTL